MPSLRRPAARAAVALVAFAVAVSMTRSDARIAASPRVPFDVVRIATAWHGASMSRLAATAQAMFAARELEGDTQDPLHVAPLRVDTLVHDRRAFEAAAPVITYSAHLEPGQRRVVRPGRTGIAWVTERVTLWNDVVVGRQTLSTVTVRAAAPAVVLEGTPRTLDQLRRSEQFHGIASALTMVATAYTADTATAYPTGYTATGVLAHQGIVAVDPRVIPLGTKLFVPGYGVAIAADTGGAIIGDRIDLCMDSYGDAINFGRQTVQVYVLKR